LDPVNFAGDAGERLGEDFKLAQVAANSRGIRSDSEDKIIPLSGHGDTS
jgi:hypothetical protein